MAPLNIQNCYTRETNLCYFSYAYRAKLASKTQRWVLARHKYDFVCSVSENLYLPDDRRQLCKL